MKKSMLLLALIVSSPAIANELTAGELYDFCNAKDVESQAACRFYILGAAQGCFLPAMRIWIVADISCSNPALFPAFQTGLNLKW
jgi:hypothetical protein